MKAFIYRNLSANGFLSETSILGKKIVPPLTLKKYGGPTSANFLTSHSFQRYARFAFFWPKFVPKILVSERSPVAHKFLYMKALI